MSGQDRIEKVAATQDIVEPSQCQGFNVLLAHADEDEESTYPYSRIGRSSDDL